MKALTFRQQQVLDFIRTQVADNGYPPTLREIARHFNFSGPRAAVKHLEALERKGHIRRDRGASRGMDVIGAAAPGAQRRSPVTDRGREVPVLGTVPAGPLDLAVENVEKTVILDRSLAQDGTFLLKVRGDSMIGDHILPGDMVLVKGQETADEGDIVVVLIGEEATLKRFRRDGERMVLIPSNPRHRPLVLDGSADEIRIAGKVRAVIRDTGRPGVSP